MWSFQFRFWSILISRYLTDWEGLLGLSLILISVSSYFLQCLKITGSVFFTFNDILFAFNHTVKFFMSWLTSSFSLATDLLKWIRLVSSEQILIAWFRLLMYIKIKSGPRTEPEGTLYKTETRFDSWPLKVH